MHPELVSTPTASVLVVGSFPPVGGPAAAASLAAVRRAWAEGDDVITASLRPAGADLVAPVAGWAAGWRLDRARLAAGEPKRLVLGLEAGQFTSAGPGPSTAGHPPTRWSDRGRMVIGVAGLLIALARFDQVTLLVDGPLELPEVLRQALWRRVDQVVIPDGAQAVVGDQVVPASLVKVVDAYPVVSATAGVTALGPKEVLRQDVPVVVLGMIGRLLLGRHFFQVRFQAIRVARFAKRRIVAARA